MRHQTICPFCGNVIINDTAANLASHVMSCVLQLYPMTSGSLSDGKDREK